jgi:hypothetical protein
MQIPHVVAQMGSALRGEVERQLLTDLGHYRPGSTNGLTIDWSDPCQEGHCTDVLDGTLEEMSDVAVRDSAGNMIAEGWVDFVHGGGILPLHVFWLFLDIFDRGEMRKVKDDVGIPAHVWAVMSEASKDAAAVVGRYDARWKDDPKVVAWRRRAG